MLQCVDSSTKKKRFSIICFHCQIVRSDEFPNSKWHTLEAGSYLVSEQSRENNHKKSPQEEASSFQLLVSFLGCQSSNAHASSMAWPHSKSPVFGLWYSYVLLSGAWPFWSTLNSLTGHGRAALVLAMPSVPSGSISSSVPLGPVFIFAPSLRTGLSSSPARLPASWLRPMARVRHQQQVTGSKVIYVGFIQTANTPPASVLLALEPRSLISGKSHAYIPYSQSVSHD